MFNQAQRLAPKPFRPGNPPFRPNNPVTTNPNPLPPRQNLCHPNNRNPAHVNSRVSQLQSITEEDQADAHIHVAIEHQGDNQQFSVLQTPAEYEGKPFTLLIDSGSTHSFLSPRCVRNLRLHERPDTTLTVELATEKGQNP